MRPASTHSAMHAQHIAKTDCFGSQDDQYSKLPALQYALKQSDPAATAVLDIDLDGVFQHFFYASRATRTFFKLQCPLCATDGGHLRLAPYGLHLLCPI